MMRLKPDPIMHNSDMIRELTKKQTAPSHFSGSSARKSAL
jgi:hypothetical protein